MEYSEDHIALAAEYALGTLDAEERAQVEALMAADREFTAIVQAWEFRLGVLNQMVGSVEPRPIVWENIKAAIAHSEPQASLVLAEAGQPTQVRCPPALSASGTSSPATPKGIPRSGSPRSNWRRSSTTPPAAWMASRPWPCPSTSSPAPTL